MQALRRQARFCGKAVGKSLLDSWAAGDLTAASTSFTPKGVVQYAASEKLPRVPFSGEQMACDFFSHHAEAVDGCNIVTSHLTGDADSFAAVLDHSFKAKRTKKERTLRTLAFGEVEGGKISKLFLRPEAGAVEEAFSAHAAPIKGTENRWDDSREL